VNSSLDLFAGLRELGMSVGAPTMRGVQEVYPGSLWRSLAGAQLAPKTSPAGRKQRAEILAGMGVVGLPERPSHDELDACVAALLGAAVDGLVAGLSVLPVGDRPKWDEQAKAFREGVILTAARQATAEASSKPCSSVRGADAYSLSAHRHRFAAWAAGRAASVSTCRFKVSQALAIIESVGLQTFLDNPALLPRPGEMDSAHREWRASVIGTAKKKFGIRMSHGVAAKMINVYFKSGIVCAAHSDLPRVSALHPPIDAVLLAELARNNVGGLLKQWSTAKRHRWSNFNSREYERVIAAIRESLRAGEPLWKIEKYWQGHQ
jgi:hypothetical protein